MSELRTKSVFGGWCWDGYLVFVLLAQDKYSRISHLGDGKQGLREIFDLIEKSLCTVTGRRAL